jgi:hypothetical protein
MYISAAPSYAQGDVCKVCDATLPLHTAACPYRKSLADSFDVMSGTAATLLAGFAIAFVGLVVSSSSALRWPGWTMLVLALSGLILIFAVQAGFWARSYRPDVSAEDAAQWTLLLDEYERWTLVTRWAYNVGIALLLGGMALALVPPTGGDQVGLRLTAAIATAVAAVGELAWAVLAHRWGVATRHRRAGQVGRG